ncbi:hypothetical protein EYV94_10935 [Puteibacter caeruleilacunae]|nr:hypothetical protein EYV94_10935 [Puteibacter caeruleilacunae]
MEKPYAGRASIIESGRGLTIEIPFRRSWSDIIFMTAWLGGWLIGELMALSFILDLLGNNDESNLTSGFVVFFFIGWTVAGIWMIKNWLWYVAGKEVISFENNELRVARKASLFTSPKVFDLREVKNFQLNITGDSVNSLEVSSDKDFASSGSRGMLKFEYRLGTIKIADGIDEPEGRFILEKLKSKSIIN